MASELGERRFGADRIFWGLLIRRRPSTAAPSSTIVGEGLRRPAAGGRPPTLPTASDELLVGLRHALRGNLALVSSRTTQRHALSDRKEDDAMSASTWPLGSTARRRAGARSGALVARRLASRRRARFWFDFRRVLATKISARPRPSGGLVRGGGDERAGPRRWARLRTRTSPLGPRVRDAAAAVAAAREADLLRDGRLLAALSVGAVRLARRRGRRAALHGQRPKSNLAQLQHRAARGRLLRRAAARRRARLRRLWWEAALLAGDGSRGSHGQAFFNRAIGSKGECRIDRVQRLPPDAYATNQPRGPAPTRRGAT